MQITPLAPTNMPINNNYDAVNAAATDAKFENILRDLRKSEKITGGGHVVNEKATGAEDKRLKEVCKDFEALFLDMMYRQMRSTVPENTLFGESNAMKIFQDMRDSEMMKKVAAAGGVGLADMMYRQLSPTVLAKQAAQAAEATE